MSAIPPVGNSPTAFQPYPERESSSSRRERFLLWYYLKEAYHIITWDEDAVHRAKDDPLALAFGVCFWVFTDTLIIVTSLSIFRGKFALPSSAVLASILPFRVFTISVVSVARLWIVHLVATQFCGGDGRFIQILRPLSLASLIQLPIALIPMIFAGLGFGSAALVILGLSAILIGIANAAVTVFVFDAVDQMPQLTAFITSIVAGIGLNFALQYIVQSFNH